jgi:thioesterase domain-containing protein
LFQHPTVAALAALLSQESTNSFTNLVPIHRTGTTNPLYCLPGVFGSVMYLYPLASSLGQQQRFYALQTPGLDGSTIPESIEELASYHLKLLQQQQPTGPYQLVGHSSGSKVAFEMALLLEQQGETVSLLAILDSDAPGSRQLNPLADISEVDFLTGLVRLYERLMNNSIKLSSEALKTLPDIEAAYTVVAEAFLQHKIFFAPKAAVDELKAIFNVMRIGGQAVANYQTSRKLRCPIHLFRASEETAESKFNDTREALGWTQCTHATVTVHWVAGNHLSMMSNPHVKTLAEKLSRYLLSKPVQGKML